MTPAEPLLVFDGDCAFCTTWVHRLERALPAFPDSQPWQWIDLAAHGLSRDDVARFVWYLEPNGRRRRGHAAFAALLRAQRGLGWRALGTALLVPPISWIAALGYRLIARFRHRLPGGTPACAMPRPS